MPKTKRPLLCRLGIHSWGLWHNPVTSSGAFDIFLGKGLQWARCTRCNLIVTNPIGLTELPDEPTDSYVDWQDSIRKLS